MAELPDPQLRQPALGDDVAPLVQVFKGQYGIPVKFTPLNSSSQYALTVDQVDTANGYSMLVKSGGVEKVRVTKTGLAVTGGLAMLSGAASFTGTTFNIDMTGAASILFDGAWVAEALSYGWYGVGGAAVKHAGFTVRGPLTVDGVSGVPLLLRADTTNNYVVVGPTVAIPAAIGGNTRIFEAIGGTSYFAAIAGTVALALAYNETATAYVQLAATSATVPDLAVANKDSAQIARFLDNQKVLISSSRTTMVDSSAPVGSLDVDRLYVYNSGSNYRSLKMNGAVFEISKNATPGTPDFSVDASGTAIVQQANLQIGAGANYRQLLATSSSFNITGNAGSGTDLSIGPTGTVFVLGGTLTLGSAGNVRNFVATSTSLTISGDGGTGIDLTIDSAGILEAVEMHLTTKLQLLDGTNLRNMYANGTAFQITNNGASGVDMTIASDGRVTIKQFTVDTGPSDFAGQVEFKGANQSVKFSGSSITQTTIGANGAASALTANPLGYVKATIGGANVIIPYYNP
ncbi:MAG: hypothetical protein ACRDGM_18065 [bacterium]